MSDILVGVMTGGLLWWLVNEAEPAGMSRWWLYYAVVAIMFGQNLAVIVIKALRGEKDR